MIHVSGIVSTGAGMDSPHPLHAMTKAQIRDVGRFHTETG